METLDFSTEDGERWGAAVGAESLSSDEQLAYNTGRLGRAMAAAAAQLKNRKRWLTEQQSSRLAQASPLLYGLVTAVYENEATVYVWKGALEDPEGKRWLTFVQSAEDDPEQDGRFRLSQLTMQRHEESYLTTADIVAGYDQDVIESVLEKLGRLAQ